MEHDHSDGRVLFLTKVLCMLSSLVENRSPTCAVVVSKDTRNCSSQEQIEKWSFNWSSWCKQSYKMALGHCLVLVVGVFLFASPVCPKRIIQIGQFFISWQFVQWKVNLDFNYRRDLQYGRSWVDNIISLCR